jgi:hypothetical protein
MSHRIAKNIAGKVDATAKRIGVLEGRLEAARNPARRIWIRHLIGRNQRKFDRAIAPLVDQADLKGAIEKAEGREKKIPATYEELQARAMKDYQKAWEAAEDKSESIFITTGKTVPPEELLVKPASYVEFERAVDSAVRETVHFSVSSIYSSRHMRQAKPLVPLAQVPGMIAAPIVGAVSGFFIFPASIWGPIGGAALALACVIMIATEGRRR